MGKILSNIKILSRLPLSVLLRRALSRLVTPKEIQLDLQLKSFDLLSNNDQLKIDLDVVNDIKKNVIHVFDKVDFGQKIRWDFTDDKFPKKDIRITWELGRMHFLKDLAIDGGDEARQKYVSLITSFVEGGETGETASQWSCAMEVGIRLSNWLVSYSIFKSKGDFSEEFNQLFDEVCRTHIQYIWNNLEHKEGLGNNHYLFNLSSLLLASRCYSFPDHYFDFIKDQFLHEIDQQFFNDGGNFEGSTAYHLHGVEAVSVGLSCLVNAKTDVEKAIWDKWIKALSLAELVIDDSGDYLRFGDDDSGYYLEQSSSNPAVNKKWVGELIKAWEGSEKAFSSLSAYWVQTMLQDFKLDIQPSSWEEQEETFQLFNHHQETVITHDPINLEEMEPFAFLDFGLYGFKSDGFKLSVSGISNPNMHCSWGHVHNDQMSFELIVNGQALVKSPGTYVYNANPLDRNLFRSVKAQHGIDVGEEPNHWENTQWGLFYLSRDSRVQLLKMNKTELVLRHEFKKYRHIRKFNIHADKLIIDDWCNHPFKVNVNQFKWYSPIYGRKEKMS